MNDNKNILILNTGGTFNKVYNEINGKLFVPHHNQAIDYILKTSKINNIKVDGIIYKDSLDIKKSDRKKLVQYINKSTYKKIIIIHGTDTINITAKYLKKKIKNKLIVLTGSMKPFSINPIEATANLMTAFGFIQTCKENKVYICMHGLIKQPNKIKKNKKLGLFECHS